MKTVFGVLTIVRPVSHNTWLVRCKCGKESVKRKPALHDAVKGCSYDCPFSRAAKAAGRQKHCVHQDHPAIYTWNAMKARCTKPHHPFYPYYGARGITVCQRWLDSFNNFWEDMGPTWERGLELDRIDNDGGYSPENCRWITHRENMCNRRTTVIPSWAMDTAKRNGISRGTLYCRMKRGWDAKKACTEKPTCSRDWL